MRRFWLTGLVLFLTIFAIFSPVLPADFIHYWDDGISVYQNPHIQGLDWARLRWMFSDAGYAMRYKPLTWLAYALLYQAGGLKPFGYHLANLLLHSFNTVLVFVVLRRLLAAGPPTPRAAERLGPATLPAAAGALLWGINPLRVEPVARVTDLTFCLMLCFLLISLWCYLRAFGGNGAERGRKCFYCGSVAAFALAALSYPFAFAYGLVLLVLDAYPLRRFAGCGRWWRDARARRILLEKIPFLLLGATMLPTLFARLHPAGVWAVVPVDTSFGPLQRAMQALYVWAYYAWKPWFPFHLSPLYTTLVDIHPAAWPFWSSAAWVVGTTALLLWRRRQAPWALALWVSHLVLLVPVLGLTDRPHYPSDRYDYLPGLVWAVAIAAALWRLSSLPKLRAAGMVCALALALFWGGLSVRQTRVWHDSGTLFNHMLRELGNDPCAADIHWRLGLCLAGQGRTSDAVRQYQASLQIQPSANTYAAFARLMESNGRAEAALTNYLALLQYNHDPATFAKVGELLSKLGRAAEALNFYRQTLQSFPNLPFALNNLAWRLATDRNASNRNGPEAVQRAEFACALTEHQNPVLVGTLAAAYAEAGRFKEAVAAAQQARALAQAAGQPEVAEKNRQLLKLYQSGRPYREPPPASGPSQPAH